MFQIKLMSFQGEISYADHKLNRLEIIRNEQIEN